MAIAKKDMEMGAKDVGLAAASSLPLLCGVRQDFLTVATLRRYHRTARLAKTNRTQGESLLAAHFTRSQIEAIKHIAGNLQLIACAGSGKTEVVAQRVVNLLRPVADGGAGCQPDNIIAFTFTDKAAAELKQRIHARCREQLGDISGLAEMYVGTIHGFCLDLLKSEVPQYMKYEVLNEVQQVLFVDRHSKASGLTESTTIDGKPLKRYTDTRNYVSAMSILREDKRRGSPGATA